MNVLKSKFVSLNLFSPLTFLLKKLKLQVTSVKDFCVNEVLFYGAEDEEQRLQVGLNNLFCIHYTMVHANKSIDFCITKLTSDIIYKCLVNVARKGGVTIRLALYDDKIKYKILLEKLGVQIRVIDLKMEHEFVLIDAEDTSQGSVAIMGALDYDMPDVISNRGSTILVSDVKVVGTLKREFERIWNQTEID